MQVSLAEFWSVMGPLAKGGTIRREVWESQQGLISPYQHIANALDLGTPIRGN